VVPDVYIRVTAQAIAMASEAESVGEGGPLRLAALFDAHHARLHRLARRMSSSAEDAQDIVQETFLRAARSLRSVPEGPNAEEAWLVRVLVNVCRDGWRRKASRARLASVHGGAPGQGAAQANPEAAFVARTTIWRALQQLPARRRAAIVMYELEGASISDIAILLGVSAVTVRWHLSRGRKELARVIADYDRQAAAPGDKS